MSTPTADALKFNADKFNSWFEFNFDIWGKRPNVIDELFDAIIRDKRRVRLPRGDNKNQIELCLKSLLANLLYQFKVNRDGFVSYSRNENDYKQSRYHPGFLSYSHFVRTSVDRLSDIGLIEKYEGKQGEYTARMRATGKLVALCAEYGLSGDAVVLNFRGPPTVELRDSNKKRIILPDFDGRDGVLAAYNQFVAGADITLDLNEKERDHLAKRLPERKAHAILEGDPNANYMKAYVDVNDRFVRRIFSNVDPSKRNLDQGGRIFGGFWQQLPREFRQYIRINGESVVDLDFSGCNIRLLYNSVLGEECPYSDPYMLNEVRDRAATEDEWETYRGSIKKIFNTLLHSKPGQRTAIDQHLLPLEVTGKQVENLLKEKHPKLKPYFRAGYGLKLMNLESTICHCVLDQCSQAEIVVLPMHDGFIVPISQAEIVEQFMGGTWGWYCNRFNAVIKRKLNMTTDNPNGAKADRAQDEGEMKLIAERDDVSSEYAAVFEFSEEGSFRSFSRMSSAGTAPA